jgi:hypothetical protein
VSNQVFNPQVEADDEAEINELDTEVEEPQAELETEMEEPQDV